MDFSRSYVTEISFRKMFHSLTFTVNTSEALNSKLHYANLYCICYEFNSGIEQSNNLFYVAFRYAFLK